MTTENIDRRVARTRRALHEALMRLILTKDYGAISVQDIIDEADVGRATFYSHYRSKDDLLRGGFAQLRDELRKAQADADDPFAFGLALFEHACSYRPVFAALVGGRGGAIALQQIRNALSEIVGEELTTRLLDSVIPRVVAIDFVVSTCITVLGACLNRRVISTPAEAADVFRKLVATGLGDTLKCG